MSIRSSLSDLFARLTGGTWQAIGGVLGVIVFVLTGLGLTGRWWYYAALVASYAVLFWAYHVAVSERDQLQDSLQARDQSAPRFVFAETRWSPFFLSGQSALLYNGLQLWLKNAPEYRGHNSVARNVSPTVSVLRDGQTLFTIRSEWLEAQGPDLAGHVGHRAAVDVPANNVPVKLMIAIKHRDEVACYAHSFGALLGHPDGRDPRYRLLPGSYNVRVQLEGDNIEQDLRFRLENVGNDPLRISPL